MNEESEMKGDVKASASKKKVIKIKSKDALAL